MPTPPSLEASIFRVLDPSGETVGAGFLVAGQLGVTCAHVVEAAGARPGEAVTIVFFQGGPPLPAAVLEQGWRDKSTDDTAFLEIPLLPDGAQPVQLAHSKTGFGREYGALGFPRSKFYGADWPQGRIGGCVPVTNRAMQPLLQIDGIMIENGLSGGPVQCQETAYVVGMVTEYGSEHTLRRGYATTAETLAGLCPAPLEVRRPVDLLLDRCYRPPEAVFERVNLSRFAGRKWLDERVDEFLARNRSGAFLLIGEAGVGKTTYLAHLVQERGYLHLFGGEAAGEANLRFAQRYLGAQIAARCDLEGYARGDAFEGGKLPQFFGRSARRSGRKTGGRRKAGHRLRRPGRDGCGAERQCPGAAAAPAGWGVPDPVAAPGVRPPGFRVPAHHRTAAVRQ